MKTTHKIKFNPLTNKVIIFLCLSAVLIIIGCENKGPAEKAGQKIDKSVGKAEQKIEQMTDKASEKIEGAKQSVVNQYKATEGYIDDSVITQKVKTVLSNDAILKPFQIEVVTANGVVTLSGSVDSEQSIGRAMELAESQPQVKTVKTALVVNADAVSK